MNQASEQLDEFVARFVPKIGEQAKAAIADLRSRYPTANLLVYDNYNALAVGFAADQKRGGIIFSVTLYPKWVSLFFSRGVELDDANGLLEGAGTSIRHIKLRGGVTHDEAGVVALLDQSIAIAEPPLPNTGKGELIIQSISAKQRPRRP